MTDSFALKSSNTNNLGGNFVANEISGLNYCILCVNKAYDLVGEFPHALDVCDMVGTF